MLGWLLGSKKDQTSTPTARRTTKPGPASGKPEGSGMKASTSKAPVAPHLRPPAPPKAPAGPPRGRDRVHTKGEPAHPDPILHKLGSDRVLREAVRGMLESD
jgi:hypothetical protein